jgi:hypothetical protein
MASPDAPASRRDFEHLSATVEKLTRTLESLQLTMAATYVRKDVYEADQKVHDKTHAEHTEDIDSLKSTNQWILRSVGAALIPLIIGALVTLLVIMITGGVSVR